MDKREFYKELMQQYTFDEEKIRRNAKRNASGFGSLSAKWLPVGTAAAVFVSVFGGYMLMSQFSGNNPVPESVVSDANTFSASDRLREMEKNTFLIGSNAFPNETATWYATFASKMTYPELIRRLEAEVSDTGIVQVEKLYLDDGFVDAGDYLNNHEVTFTAAKLRAPTDLYDQLRAVFLMVEDNSGLTDDNFSPLESDEVFATQPEVTTALPVETTPEETTTLGQSTPEKTESTTAPEQTTAPESVTEETLPADETGVPGQTLMLNIPVSNVTDVQFVSENLFVALSKSTVSFYRIDKAEDGHTYTLVSSYECNNPRLWSVCADTGNTIIMASDSAGQRTSLFVASGATGALEQITFPENAQVAKIVNAFTSGGKLLVLTQSSDFTSTIWVSDSGGPRKLEDYSSDKFITILTFDAVSFIFAVRDTEGTKLYDYYYAEGYVEEMSIGLSGQLMFARSPGHTNFAVISGEEAYIFSYATAQLSEVMATDYIKFSDYNDAVFTDGTDWYRLDGLELENISTTEATALSVKPRFSTTYSLFEVSAEMIRIEVA